MSGEEEMVTITKKEYDGLISDSDFYNALRDTGVRYWSYFSNACDRYKITREKRKEKT